jgi:hypothetical protein
MSCTSSEQRNRVSSIIAPFLCFLFILLFSWKITYSHDPIGKVSNRNFDLDCSSKWQGRPSKQISQIRENAK